MYVSASIQSQWRMIFSIFFFKCPATTKIYTLSLHDALPIYLNAVAEGRLPSLAVLSYGTGDGLESAQLNGGRSEEHTSELQSLRHLVCRLLLEKKKKQE